GGEFAAGIVIRLPNRTDAEIANTVRNGLPNRGMPAFNLAAKESDDLVAYLRTLRPPRRGAIAAMPVTVDTTDGGKLSGIAVNRTFFDMQLRSADGRVHLLRKEGARYREVTSQADWPGYDGQPFGNRYSPLQQIDRANVARLVPK